MKKETIVGKIKEGFTQYKGRIRIATVVIMFVVGFLVFYNLIQQPLTDEQSALCEQVAYEVATKLPDTVTSISFTLQVTDDFSVNVSTIDNNISVKPANSLYFTGRVIAKFQDGTFMPEWESGPIFLISTLIGFLCSVIGLMIISDMDR